MAFRPELAYRIASRRHPLFDASGALLCGARWNSPGRRIIYAADSLAAAMLEVLVHSSIGKVPRTHAWIEIRIPASVSIEVCDARSVPGWNLAGSRAARRFGDEWHASGRTAILAVPSVATFGANYNLLINQDHPEVRRLRASAPRELIWDSRLFSR